MRTCSMLDRLVGLSHDAVSECVMLYCCTAVSVRHVFHKREALILRLALIQIVTL